MTAAEPSFARTLTVLNLKGGVGKTHTSWLLAAVCQERSRRILLIDTDAQANLTNSFLPQREGLRSVETLFDPAAESEPQALIRSTVYSQIDILPASPALARVDVSDPEQWEHADLHLSLVAAVEPLRAHYDYIVFDCPPRLSVVSIAALCASDPVVAGSSPVALA